MGVVQMSTRKENMKHKRVRCLDNSFHYIPRFVLWKQSGNSGLSECDEMCVRVNVLVCECHAPAHL